MPKDIIKTKRDSRIFRTKPARKFKIGGRKSGTSAMLMSNADLQAVLKSADKKRYHTNARSVLERRGISV